MAIHLDVSGMLRAAVPDGPDAAALDALAPRLEDAAATFAAMDQRACWLGGRQL